MKTKLTHGKRIGIIILVGEKMGYDILFKEQAVLLYQDDNISPIYIWGQ